MIGRIYLTHLSIIINSEVSTFFHFFITFCSSLSDMVVPFYSDSCFIYIVPGRAGCLFYYCCAVYIKAGRSYPAIWTLRSHYHHNGGLHETIGYIKCLSCISVECVYKIQSILPIIFCWLSEHACHKILLYIMAWNIRFPFSPVWLWYVSISHNVLYVTAMSISKMTLANLILYTKYPMKYQYDFGVLL